MKKGRLRFAPEIKSSYTPTASRKAQSASGALFGLKRLDQAISECSQTAAELIQAVLQKVDAFAAGQPADDDRTMLVAKIS